MSASLFHDGASRNPYEDAPAPGTERRLSGAALNPNNYLSPFSPQQQSNTTSPTLNNTDTPADSISSYNTHCVASDYSDLDDTTDPFFGVDFSNADGTPAFLEEGLQPISRTSSFGELPNFASNDSRNDTNRSSLGDNSYPLSPEHTASIHTLSPPNDQPVFARNRHQKLPDSVSPQDLQRPFQPIHASLLSANPAVQLTPDPSRSGRSSEDDLIVGRPIMPPSPRVTVSVWGPTSGGGAAQAVERSFEPDHGNQNIGLGCVGMAGDLIFSQQQMASMPPPPPPQNETSIRRTASVGRRGVEPSRRTNAEVDTVNEMVRGHEIRERNQAVDLWFNTIDQSPPPEETSRNEVSRLENPDPSRQVAEYGIEVGNTTENKIMPDQIYVNERGGELTPADLDVLREDVFGNRPATHSITRPDAPRFASANDAIADYHRRLFDNESIASKAATWGTRRRSLSALDEDDINKFMAGNLFKKLSISRGDKHTRRPSLLGGLRDLVRRPSINNILKRRDRSAHEDEDDDDELSSPERQESFPTLMPPSRTPSWGNKKAPVPSINTALISMGSGVAAIGSTHTRNGSVSATPRSPRSPFANLQVKNTLQRRPRSKSDLPKGSADGSPSTLINLIRQNGGVPISTLGTTANWDADDDDDDEEEAGGVAESEASRLIDGVQPNFAGFQQHILSLNPTLKTDNKWLVDRIAQQQVVRYKTLLQHRVKHLKAGRGCAAGPLCVAMGGTAKVLEPKGGVDPITINLDPEDGDVTPIEGVVTQESFPSDIPMPPTQSLPAEFECQLCFQAKKFHKPSDWTKHVHEDVQPFTCTWEKCKEPKIFKRKADWVRHENEGHRHLEWWTCDVEDCRHTCYRRDNFLQHLVREHKFQEPAVKTKAALKKAGSGDPTWQRVERCHTETGNRPQQEPCRFCGRTFPSWKKLTVHLAKHMEQLSLPVLRLVSKKDLDPDTIISPISEPPSQLLFNTPSPFTTHQAGDFQQGQAAFFPTPDLSRGISNHASAGPPYLGINEAMHYPGNQTQGQAFVPHLNISTAFGPGGPISHGNQMMNQQGHMRAYSVPGVYNTHQQQYVSAPQDSALYMGMDQNGLGLQPPAMNPYGGGNQAAYDLLSQDSPEGLPYGSQGPSPTFLQQQPRNGNSYYGPGP
ncbi:hypothetical protein F5X68DRAFT_19357 [Plectosphaerella plurivora]|uniref:C2H2-type domain-containing protein n=1 Tax=Plectosphaerella plurivora TaxID=936078 RepID=A0A9P8V8T8_9PEZI|nr:hypothetical protein F5X68DRAFT_19357 [Plectosphaerella plurivora]